MTGYIARIRSGIYTDSDVALFYVTERYNYGPFIREIGDFIAHPMRDKGQCFEVSIYTYSQIRMFDLYSGRPAILDVKNRGRTATLEANGDCEWWVKPYFLGKAERSNNKELKRELGMSKAKLIEEVKSWFPSKEQFPTKIHSRDEAKFKAIKSYFGRILDLTGAFKASNVRTEVLSAFSQLGIDSSFYEQFILGTATAINGKSIEVPGLIEGDIELVLSSTAPRKERGPIRIDSASGTLSTGIGVDGQLSIYIGMRSPDIPRLTQSFPLLDTEINTKDYFETPLEFILPPETTRRRLTGCLEFHSSPRPRVLRR